MLAGAQTWTFPVSPQGQAMQTVGAAQAPVSSIAAMALSLAQPLALEAGWVVHIVTAASLNSLAAQSGLPPAIASQALAQLTGGGLLTLYRGRYLLCDVDALRRVVRDQRA